jgi:serine protease
VLTYHGGALVRNPDVFVLFWGPQWNSDAEHIAAKNSLIAMFQAIGASGFACAWREYGMSSEPLGAGTYSGSYVIASAPPNPLDDSVIQNQIVAEVLAGHAPSRTDDRIYFVVPPSGVAVSADGETGCGGSNFQFCGYHNDFANGGAFRYAVLPYPCNDGLHTCFVDQSDDAGKALQVVGSHELTETVTDPDSNPGGWFSDRTGDENADICAGIQCVDSVTEGTETFSVNPAWSNLAKGCITSVPCLPQPIGCTDPAPGACVPGAGTTSSCEVEWLVDPNLTLKKSTGAPSNTVSCTDGQTFCDFDNVVGQCTFHVAACLNSQDPRLPLCTAAPIHSIAILRPKPTDPITVTLLAALKTADGASSGTVAGATVTYTPTAASPNACTSYMSVVVPAGGKTKIQLLAATAGGPAISSLKLFCTP